MFYVVEELTKLDALQAMREGQVDKIKGKFLTFEEAEDFKHSINCVCYVLKENEWLRNE